jgi:hypothetical protein
VVVKPLGLAAPVHEGVTRPDCAPHFIKPVRAQFASRGHVVNALLARDDQWHWYLWL